jgi:hypothetical protein
MICAVYALRLVRIGVELVAATVAIWLAFLLVLASYKWWSGSLVDGPDFMVMFAWIAFLQAVPLVAWLERRWHGLGPGS